MFKDPTKIYNNPTEYNDLALVLLAAGYSSRMKLFKPLLQLENSTVIETTIDSFLKAGIKNIIVVLGYKADKLKSILNKKGVKWVYNHKYNEGMYSSVLAGVKALPSDTKGFFLLPSDMPLIKSETIEILGNTYLFNRPYLLYPTYMNRRGHPPLISSELFSEIIMHDGSQGLNGVLKKYKEEALHIEVEDEGIHIDMDTYEEYLTIYNRMKHSSQKCVSRV